jgi:chemotaxis family two-component system response regulator Rcp1
MTMQPVEVLMVDDNRGDVVLVQAAAAKRGLPYHFAVARDGVEALAYLRRQGPYADVPRPELIVLDLKLPRQSGHEVLDRIEQDPELRAIPLVVVSSSSSELALVRLRRPAAPTCLVKPSDFAGYVDLVGTVEAFRLSPGRDTPRLGAAVRPTGTGPGPGQEVA